jgi:GNAT superfamily N-acetyltransferase
MYPARALGACWGACWVAGGALSTQGDSSEAVVVERLSMPEDTGRFVKPWWQIYRDDPHWVPPLIFERKRFFDPKVNPYFKVADVACFLASRAGQPVGTIAATVDHNYQREEPGGGFFGFFEFIDDESVSQALFAAAAGWLREQGMDRALGPFNFNSNHEFALLVDGFDSDPLVANPHNAAYFERHYLALGLEPKMDWYAYRFGRNAVDPRVIRVANRVLSRHPEIKIRTLDLSHFDREVEVLHAIYDDAWEHNWGHVKMEREEFEYLASGFRQFIDPNLCFVVELGGEAVGLAISFPDMNQVVKKMNGGLFPFGWWHFIRRKRVITQMRIFMLGVKQEYQHLPLGSLLYAKTWEHAMQTNLVTAEASLILENNQKMRGPIEKLGGEIYKTYRSFEKKL